jgi:WD40 repeat protein
MYALAVNSTGTLVASTSNDNHYVRLWQHSDKKTIALFKHSDGVYCVAFSTDGKHIFSRGNDDKISQWAVPEDALLHNTPGVGSHIVLPSLISPKDTLPYNSSEEQLTSPVS